MSIRSKVLWSMMLLAFLICTAFCFLLYQQNARNRDLLVEGKRDTAGLLAESILSSTRQHYQMRIKSFINYRVSVSKEQMIRAFAKRDRDELFRLSLPFYEILKEENPYFMSFGWILPDNQVFLRVHKPEDEHGNIAGVRQDIVMVNRDRVQLSGFSIGRNGSQFRVLQPVYYNGEYLGVLQMGVDARFVIETLKEKMNIATGLTIANKGFERNSGSGARKLVCNSQTVYTTDEQLFGEFIKGVDWESQGQHFTINGKRFALHRVLPLNDFKDDHFGCLFVAIDISGITEATHKSLMTALLLSGLLLFLTYVLLYLSFGFLIDKILSLNRTLEKSNVELEERVEERTQAFFAEVEERKIVEDKLHRAEKMEAIGLMASGVAHDLNNILTGIVSYPQLLLMRLPADSYLRKPICEIKESGLRAAAVVADLLTVARDAAKVRTCTSLNALILDYLQSPEANLLRSNYPDISIETFLDPQLPGLCCSPTHVNKCLMNLVINAAEAFDGPGTITLSTSMVSIDAGEETEVFPAHGDYLAVQVQDDGPGISAADVGHIFEPFYTKKKMGRSGTGIGLAVVWNCMQDHGGHVSVQSHETQGTTFTLIFPASEDVTCPVAESKKVVDINGKGQRLLVVDDELRQREIAKDILHELGYDVICCSSGEQAIEHVKKEPVDLLILDMMMEPGMDGSQTYAEIKKIYPSQKAVIVSGFSEENQMNAALAQGVQSYLLKPYTIEQLGTAVVNVLNASDSKRTLVSSR